jgi:hypothetical protein
MSDNDIAEILSHFDAPMLMRIAFCNVSTAEVTEIMNKLGKVEINIGDGLTLLHQASQFDRPDLVDLLLSRDHPLEVKNDHIETFPFLRPYDCATVSNKSRRNTLGSSMLEGKYRVRTEINKVNHLALVMYSLILTKKKRRCGLSNEPEVLSVA